ncbi:MAG: hypothetical protein EOO11_11055 [Chitinophagaceae bacterium]|nr:MAG: hypothetical protein EOO11_11055 [Chitinophagaceae bacterium]
MNPYYKFLVNDTDRFDPMHFPQLEETLRHTRAELGTDPSVPSIAMVVSFARDHSLNSVEAAANPVLAERIGTKELSLDVLEQLFDSSRRNPSFRKDLEDYTIAYLSTSP